MPIFKELRKAIAESGRSQRDIAKAAGIHHVTLSRFMTGNRELSVDSIERLAAALKLSIRLSRIR